MADYDTLIVGGGFHGAVIAQRRGLIGERVLLLEQRPDLLQRASLVNQARLHFGVLDGSGCAEPCGTNQRLFMEEFGECLHPGLTTYLAIGRSAGKLTASRVFTNYRQAGIRIEQAGESVRRSFDPAHIETVFRVGEPLLDTGRLRQVLWDRLDQAGVEVELNTEVDSIHQSREGSLEVSHRKGVVRARQVINCCYSQLNALLHRSGVAPLPLRHERVELALVEVPGNLREVGVHILCGPFFSLNPFPTTRYHAFVQTRYQPYAGWGDLGRDGPTPQEVLERMPEVTGFERMRREASRYLPCLEELRYQHSLWEVKTLPCGVGGDERPALVRFHVGFPNLHCMLGTRLDSIYDLLAQLDHLQTPNLVPSQIASWR